MMLFIKTTFFFLLLSLTGLASVSVNIDNLDWERGVIVLKNNSVKTGSIYYNHSNNLVLLRSNRRVITFTTDKIKSIRWFDSSIKSHRYFVHFKSETKNTLKSNNILYEVIINGSIKVYRVPKKFRNDLNNHANYNYFINANNRLYSFSEFKKYIIPLLFGADYSLLKKNIKEYNIDLNNLGHCVKLVDLSNQATKFISNIELTSVPQNQVHNSTF